MPKQLSIKQSEEKPIPTEVMAESIVAISQGVKRLREGPLNDKCLLLLIQHAAPTVRYNGGRLAVSDIRAVLDGMEQLEATYLKKRR